MSKKPGTFQPGNKAAVGNSGPPPRHRIVTQVIIAKLNEVDKNTGRANVWRLVDELFEQAFSRKVGKGKKAVRVLGDLAAMREIMDRAEGKAIQGVDLGATGGKVTFVFEPGEEKL